MYNPYREIVELESDDDEEKSSSKVDKVVRVDVNVLENNQMTTIEKGDNDDNVGVYKDKNGKIHYYNISCTHIDTEFFIAVLPSSFRSIFVIIIVLFELLQDFLKLEDIIPNTRIFPI